MTGTRVLLLHTNREHAPYPAMPLGLSLVASSLEAAGFETRLLDLCFSRHPTRDLVQALRRWLPDVIGLAIRNLDNGESRLPRRYLPEVVPLAHLCRDLSSAPLVIGGPAVSIAPGRLLERTGADYAVVGDGEEALPALVACLARGETPGPLPGICVHGAAAPATAARVADLAALPPARLGKWLDVPRYLRAGTRHPLQTRRGCSFQCTYCTYRFIEGTTYRLRPPDAVAEDLADAVQHLGARHVDVIDSTFNRPAGHSVAVCEAILRAGVRADLQATDFSPAGVTQELLALMARAGFTSLICTPESGSERMLESLRKGFTAQDIHRTAGWAHALGLPVLWMFMFGGPGEDEDTVRETVRLMEACVGPRDRAICTLGLRVYPGTELARIARGEGVLAPEADLTDPVFYFSPLVSPRRVLQLLDASPMRSRLVYLQTLQEPLVAWTARVRSALHLPGPLWSSVPLYNRVVRPFRRD